MQRSGFTLIELLLVATLTGTLLGVGAVMLNGPGVAAGQAAQALAGSVTRARFEAVRANRTASLALDAEGAGGYSICVDEDADGACTADEVVHRVRFGEGDLGRLTLAGENLPPSGALRFDRRGVPLDAVASAALVIADAQGEPLKRVELSSTGRPQVR